MANTRTIYSATFQFMTRDKQPLPQGKDDAIARALLNLLERYGCTVYLEAHENEIVRIRARTEVGLLQ
jgi:hypothetical protein